MRYERVKIKRDDRTTYNRAVLPWEIAILEFTFGEGNVIRVEGYEDNTLPYPEAREEFHRLMSVYGSDNESGIPYVASVYGQARAGVRQLGLLIKEAEVESRRKLPKQPRAQLVKEYSADPILG